MSTLRPVALNSDIRSRYAQFAVAEFSDATLLNAHHPHSHHPVELFAPVFPNKYAADVFCLVYPKVDIPATSNDEITLARQIEEFQERFEGACDGLNYPTVDGRYPTAAAMAGWYILGTWPAITTEVAL